MHAETLHLHAVDRGEPDWTRDPGELLQEILDEGAYSLVGALMGAALRYTREHPHDEDPSLRKMAREAEGVVATLPTRLLPLWELHYVEGHPLAVYADSTGLDATATQADYFEIIRELGRAILARAANDVSNSGVRRTVVRSARNCLPA
jgi:hypothetical protein